MGSVFQKSMGFMIAADKKERPGKTTFARVVGAEIAKMLVFGRSGHRGQIRLVPVRFEVTNLQNEAHRRRNTLGPSFDETHHCIHLPVDVANGRKNEMGRWTGIVLHEPRSSVPTFRRCWQDKTCVLRQRFGE